MHNFPQTRDLLAIVPIKSNEKRIFVFIIYFVAAENF